MKPNRNNRENAEQVTRAVLAIGSELMADCTHEADVSNSEGTERPAFQQCNSCGAVRTEDVVTLANGRLGWEWLEWKR